MANLLSKEAYNQGIMDKISVAQYYHDPFNKQVRKEMNTIDERIALIPPPTLST